MPLDQQSKQIILQKVYYDPSQGLFNAQKLYEKVKQLGIRLKEVREYIKKQKTGQMYHGPTSKDITGPPGSYQADLIFYPKTKVLNQGYNAALTVIEITSRMGYCIPMKGKKTEQVLEAMNTFLSKPEVTTTIKSITTDKGTEFTSKAWKKLMTDHKIKHVLAEEGDHNKMGMIERFNRTIKLLISKYQTTNKTKKWVDAVPQLLTNYNNTIHSSTGYAPSKVGEKEMAIIRLKASQRTVKLDQKKNINVGDKVRIAEPKTLFGKEGPRWSDELFTVSEDNTKSFKLDGHNRRFKHYELLKVPTPAEENPNFPRRAQAQHEPRPQPIVIDEPSPIMTRTRTGAKAAPRQIQQVEAPKAQKKGQRKKAAQQEEEEQFFVEKILEHKEDADGTIQYKVRFVGYGPEDDLWYYDEDMLQTAPEMVDEYHNRRRR